MVAAGMVEQPHPETITPWDAPSWREAAAEYHRDRSGRLAVEIEPTRLEHLRRLMADNLSLERVYDEIGRNRATTAITVEALKLAVREHGPETLAEPTNQARLRSALQVAVPDRMSIDDIMAATERRDRGAIKSLLHKMRVAGEVASEKGRYSLPPADPLNAVDRVDQEGSTAFRAASISDADGGQRSSQPSVNSQRCVDRALIGTKTDKPLNAASNSDPDQQVNAANGLEYSKPADDGLDIPRFLERRPGAVPHDPRPALGSGGRP